MKHLIHQAEGGEQGDPLMPLLFCLAVHDALANVQLQLREGETFSLSWTTCTLSRPQTALAQYTTRWPNSCGLSQASDCTVARHECGIELSECLPDMDDLGKEVWNPEGIKILRTPVGSVRSTHRRHAAIGSLTCSRLGKSSSSARAPVATIFFERCPPSQSTHYAAEHDEGMLKVMSTLWVGFRVEIRRRRTLAVWQHSPCAWAGWV